MRYLTEVVTLELDALRCVGCGLCVEVCPSAVLSINNRKSTIIDRDACIECGACMTNCASAAISVTRGVGCAAAVINDALGRSGDCCCSTDKSRS